MSIDIHPLTSERFADLDQLFAARGCAVAKQCYCMFYRRSSSTQEKAKDVVHPPARTALQQLASKGQPAPGLLAYRDGVAVGWVSLGPRTDFARLAQSRLMAAVDDKPVWSIICFVVPTAYRAQGIAHALLKGAIDFAREHGVEWLEAYPVDRSQKRPPNDSWFGSESMFLKAGFTEVIRRSQGRPLMRLRLTAEKTNPS